MTEPRASHAPLSDFPFCSVDALLSLSQILESVMTRNVADKESISRVEATEGGSFPDADGISIRGGEDMGFNFPSSQGEGSGDYDRNDFRVRGGKKRWKR